MHVVCFVLLFLSQFFYFKSLDTWKLSSQSLMQLLTIPAYVIVLYEAEYSLRKFRPNYNEGATAEDFTLMTPELNTEEGGEFCTSEKSGNAQQWIWVEIIAFQANVIVIFIQLLQSYCASTSIMEPKNADLIYCVDNRGLDMEPKKETQYMVFNLLMDEIYAIKEHNFFPDEKKVENTYKIETLKLFLDDDKPYNERKTFDDLPEEDKPIWTEYRDAKMNQLRTRNSYLLKNFP